MVLKGRGSLSQWDKSAMKKLSPRVAVAITLLEKNGCIPITLPKQYPMNKAYIELVGEAIREYFEEAK